MAWLENAVMLSLKLILHLQQMVKLLKILAVACNSITVKSMETDFGITTMASKMRSAFFKEILSLI